jgi:hypothetical protein
MQFMPSLTRPEHASRTGVLTHHLAETPHLGTWGRA